MTQAQYTTQDGIAIITLANPPVNGLGHELAHRHRRRRAQGGGRSGGLGDRHHRRRQGVLRRRRHPRVQHAQGAGRTQPGHGDPRGGGRDQAGRRGHPFGGDGRRPGARPRLPLPRRQSRRADRAAGGEARPRAGRGRHAAAAARRAARDGGEHDRQRQPGAVGEVQGHAALRRDLSTSDLLADAVAFAKQVVADKRGMPKVRDRKVD